MYLKDRLAAPKASGNFISCRRRNLFCNVPRLLSYFLGIISAPILQYFWITFLEFSLTDSIILVGNPPFSTYNYAKYDEWLAWHCGLLAIGLIRWISWIGIKAVKISDENESAFDAAPFSKIRLFGEPKQYFWIEQAKIRSTQIGSTNKYTITRR